MRDIEDNQARLCLNTVLGERRRRHQGAQVARADKISHSPGSEMALAALFGAPPS
jgi:hypothetical protein